MKLYNELAEYYFAIEANHRDIQNDIILIRTYLDGISKPSLLDLGCGSGEHLNALKKYGIRCVGIDSSEKMLDIARSRYPSGIKFIHGNFKKFDFYNEFNFIISLFGSMVYLLRDDEIDSLFWNTSRALKLNGTGIFEVWNAAPVNKIKHKPMSVISKTSYRDAIIERRRGFNTIENESRTVVNVDYLYLLYTPEGSTSYSDTHTMRAFTLGEISQFIKDNGMRITNIYANSLKETFNENSNRMLIIFQKDN